MKHTIILVLPILLIIVSCSSMEKSIESKNNTGTGQQVQVNQSRILGQVVEVVNSNEYNFILKARVLKIEENDTYPSIAVEGGVYYLTPNFVLDDGKNVIKDLEKNVNLAKLAKLQKGEKFKAIIFFEQPKAWLIQEVL